VRLLGMLKSAIEVTTRAEDLAKVLISEGLPFCEFIYFYFFRSEMLPLRALLRLKSL
jgi:hypothetical protein